MIKMNLKMKNEEEEVLIICSSLRSKNNNIESIWSKEFINSGFIWIKSNITAIYLVVGVPVIKFLRRIIDFKVLLMAQEFFRAAGNLFDAGSSSWIVNILTLRLVL